MEDDRPLVETPSALHLMAQAIYALAKLERHLGDAKDDIGDLATVMAGARESIEEFFDSCSTARERELIAERVLDEQTAIERTLGAFPTPIAKRDLPGGCHVRYERTHLPPDGRSDAALAARTSADLTVIALAIMTQNAATDMATANALARECLQEDYRQGFCPVGSEARETAAE